MGRSSLADLKVNQISEVCVFRISDARLLATQKFRILPDQAVYYLMNTDLIRLIILIDILNLTFL